MKSELICKVGRAFGKTKLFVKAKSPEILIGVAIASGVGCVVAAIIETHRHADDILESHEKAIEKIEECKEKFPEEYSKKDICVDTIITYVETGKEIARVYWPTALLGAVSIASTLGAYKIVSGRYAAALASYTALKEAFEKYRKRVVEEYGEEMDRHFLLGTKKKTFVEKNEKGEDEVKNFEECSNDICLADTQFLFAKGISTEWEPNPTYNLSFLKAQENWANNRLRSRGYILLNEILYDLGFKQTTAGAHLGWVWGFPGADDLIDFQIKELRDENGLPEYFLDFNCHGDVDCLIDRINGNKKRHIMMAE